MNLYSFTELINHFFSVPEERNRIRDEFFSRFYEDFNRRIYFVLHLSGIDYIPESDFYNTIFMDLYHRLFNVDSLLKKLVRFDPEKGDFNKWFINTVVVNEVKDWLKSVDDSTGLKRADLLRENQRMEKKSVSLDEATNSYDPASPKIGKNFTWSEYTQVFPDSSSVLECKGETTDNSIKQRVIQALSELSSRQRVLILLFYCAYLPLHEKNIQEIARETGNSMAKTRKNIDALREKMITSSKYREEECLEKEIACLQNQIEIFGKRLYRIKRELVRGQNTEKINKEVGFISEQPIGDLKAKIAELQQSPCSEHQRKEILIHQAAILNKRITRLEKKVQNQLNSLRGGKTIISASYRDLAELLNIPEGTVASGLNRAIKNFKTGFSEKNAPNA